MKFLTNFVCVFVAFCNSSSYAVEVSTTFELEKFEGKFIIVDGPHPEQCDDLAVLYLRYMPENNRVVLSPYEGDSSAYSFDFRDINQGNQISNSFGGHNDRVIITTGKGPKLRKDDRFYNTFWGRRTTVRSQTITTFELRGNEVYLHYKTEISSFSCKWRKIAFR